MSRPLLLRIVRRSEHPQAGVTLLELLIVAGLLLTSLAVASTSITWIGSLLQVPSPAGASAAMWLIRDISNTGAGAVTASNCGLTITNGPSYTISNRILTRTLAGATTRSFPGVSCVTYDGSTLRVYSDRVPGSCSYSATGAPTAAFQDRRCDYEEQAVVGHLFTP